MCNILIESVVHVQAMRVLSSPAAQHTDGELQRVPSMEVLLLLVSYVHAQGVLRGEAAATRCRRRQAAP